MLLDRLAAPIVLAPLAGGPSTPELTAAVSEAGALGFLALGYLSPEQAGAGIARVRELTRAPFGVNLFVPGPAPADPAVYAAHAERVRAWGLARDLPVGEPRFDDDAWEAKLELLCAEPPAVVSFTFGCPSLVTIGRIQEAGAEAWVTVTSPAEAALAAGAGADALVVQGAEAGGHRGSFEDSPEQPPVGLLALLALVRGELSLPLIAAGGIAAGDGVAAVLAAGARAAQLGTAFMLCPEAGTSAAQREALAGEASAGEASAGGALAGGALAGARPTELTRAFTGRLARGIRNEFLIEHRGGPSAYPEIHHLTALLRARARERGEGEAINLWAGEAYPLARELPAGQLVREILSEARAAADAALRALDPRR